MSASLGTRVSLGIPVSAACLSTWDAAKQTRFLKEPSRHFPGRTGLLLAESSFIETPETNTDRVEGVAAGAGIAG